MSQDDDLNVHLEAFQEVLANFLEAIVNSIPLCPQYYFIVVIIDVLFLLILSFRQLREICYHLNARANHYFPENNIKVLSGFIFLRFFTPAIISPHAYGIVEGTLFSLIMLLKYCFFFNSLFNSLLGELTPNQSRTLLLVAKVLQNMANGIPFGGKEQYMMPLNEFLTANTPLVRDFLTELSVINNYYYYYIFSIF